jgi:hypothetical protein
VARLSPDLERLKPAEADMLKLLLACVLVLAGTGSAFAQTCLHGADETPANKTRREEALQVAVRINAQQAMSLSPNPRQRRYRPLQELSNIPAVPTGFDLQFHTDGQTYVFSLKDRLDPCGYAIFSDQDRGVYEALPRRAAVLVPLETR